MSGQIGGAFPTGGERHLSDFAMSAGDFSDGGFVYKGPHVQSDQNPNMKLIFNANIFNAEINIC